MSTTPGDQAERVVAFGDVPDKSNHVYPSAELRKMADGVRLFWDEERRALIYRGPAPPHEGDMQP